jgi:hypothetical protein
MEDMLDLGMEQMRGKENLRGNIGKYMQFRSHSQAIIALGIGLGLDHCI